METLYRLNDREIKNAKPGEKDYRLSDGGGLYLVVKTSGRKLWRWSYEFNRKEKLLSYGPYPFVSLAEARLQHAAARALKSSGVDPAADKQARKRAELEIETASSMPTFAELTEEWLLTWSAKRSKRYVTTVRTRLDRDILPAIGATKLDQMKPSVIANIVVGIQDGREAADLARRALQKMKQIMRFAVAHGYIERSPITGIVPSNLLKAHTIENFARIEPECLPALLQKIELYQGFPLTRLAMKLMALTFVRTEPLTDRSRVILDHIQMAGPSGDFVELFPPSATGAPLKRKRAGSMAHLAFTVPDEQAVVAAAHTREPGVHVGTPAYGLDNRWNFNLFDPDGTRVEFMQVGDPAYPTPAVAVTPLDWRQSANGLGMFEGQYDVGNPALAGSSSFDPAQKQYTVSGAGANIWGRKDEFHFLWRRISGDFSLTATVRFPKQDPPSHRKAALMARQNLDEDAPYVDAVVHGSGLTELQFREAAGDLTHAVRFPVDGPVQIRLERKDGWFTMYAASEGQPLQELGAYALKLTDPVYLGLAVCSHNAATAETAVFSDVSFKEIPRSHPKRKTE